MKKITYVLKMLVIFWIISADNQSIAQNTSYYAFIPDETGNIDLDGFKIGFHAVFPQWDNNGDGNIAEAEFYNVIFRRLDTNNDKNLSAQEFGRAQKYLLDPYLKGQTFKSFDSDSDNNLSASEFESSMNASDLFKSHDTNGNGMLTRKELNATIYRLMDLDGNGYIDKREFDQVNGLYID